jgi:hypothetical protein
MYCFYLFFLVHNPLILIKRIIIYLKIMNVLTFFSHTSIKKLKSILVHGDKIKECLEYLQIFYAKTFIWH